MRRDEIEGNAGKVVQLSPATDQDADRCPSLARQARSCEMSLLVWSGISSVAMMLTTAQRAM